MRTHLKRHHPERKITKSDFLKQKTQNAPDHSHVPNDIGGQVASAEAPKTITIIINQSNTETEENDNEQALLQGAEQESDEHELEETVMMPTSSENEVNHSETVEGRNIDQDKTKDDGIPVSKHSLITHTGVEFHLCDACNKAFSTKILLVEHIVSVHSEGQKPKCKFCSKEFPQKESLRNHMLTHIGERKNQCSVCGKAFKQKGSVH